MTHSIFDFSDYKSYLHAHLGPSDKRSGMKSAIAQATGCHTSYVSQVLNGPAHFSLEQAQKLNLFLQHSSDESDLFLNLVALERAGIPELRAHFEEKIKASLERRLNIETRLGVNADYLANQITSNKFQKFASDSNGFGELAQESGPFGIGQTYTYRPDGRLASVTGGAATINYSFDALGRRISKQVTAHQGFFGCSSRNDLVYTQSYSYLIDQDKILLAKAGDGTVNLYLDGDGIDEHLGMVSPQGTVAFETDHLGSVLNTEVAGPLQAYGAFGENLGGVASLSRSSNPVQYGFAGRQLDSESGNYYNRARMYSPVLGRFTTTDPIGLDGGDANLYRYVANAPVNSVDPKGTLGPISGIGFGVCTALNIADAINTIADIKILNNQISQLNEANDQLEQLQSQSTGCPNSALQSAIAANLQQIQNFSAQVAAKNQALSALGVETVCAGLLGLPF